MLPKYLVKAFSEREHAESFAAGRVRFSTLGYYRQIEDRERRDPNEGRGGVLAPGEQLLVDLTNRTIASVPGTENHNAWALPEDHFICCLSASECCDVEALPRKFGNHYVIVESPAELLRLVVAAVGVHPDLSRNPPHVEAAAVRYDRGAHMGARFPREEMLRLAWSQKAPEFEGECEVRLHFQTENQFLLGGVPHLTLELGAALRGAHVVSVGP